MLRRNVPWAILFYIAVYPIHLYLFGERLFFFRIPLNNVLQPMITGMPFSIANQKSSVEQIIQITKKQVYRDVYLPIFFMEREIIYQFYQFHFYQGGGNPWYVKLRKNCAGPWRDSCCGTTYIAILDYVSQIDM